MNKRDLIKALFKNPTIKALYESGHFDASDINRAILMEANDENGKENEYYLEELKKQVKELKKQFDEVAAKAAKVKSHVGAKEAKPLVTKRNEIENQIKELEAKIAKLVTKDFAITKTAEKTEPNEDDKVAGSVSVFIADTLEKLQFSIEKSSSDLNQQNLDHELDQISNSTKAAIDDIIPAIEKEQDAVKAAKAGEKVDAEKTAKLAPVAQGWKNAKDSVSKAISKKGLSQQQIDEATTGPEKFKEVFGLRSTTDASTALAQFKAIDTEWLNQQLEKVKELKDQKQQQGQKFEIVPYLENIATTVMAYTEFLKEMDVARERGVNIDLERLKNIKFPKTVPTNEKEFEKFIIDAFKPAGIGPSVVSAMGQGAGSQAQGLEDELQKKYEAITADIIEKKPNLFTDEDLQVTGMRYFIGWYVDSIAENPLQEETHKDVTSSEYMKRMNRIVSYKGPGKPQISVHLQKNSKRWDKIFDTLEQMTREGQLAISASPDASEEDAIDVTPTGLPTTDAKAADDQADDPDKTQQQDVKPETREQKLLAVQPQQEEALQQKADPKADEDLGALEQPEMDSAWKEQLDTFFGKNRAEPSFMRRLLLRDQAAMLYSMIATLDKIIQGPRDKGDELEASSLSDQYNEDQPKDNLEEQVINEVFSSLFGKKEKNEPVEISKESRGHMRQDLEAMVSLLRSLKEDIRGYSKYATSSSVDPRFDGSTLKKAMDAKLEVVQERIAMLTVQIDTSISQQDKQVAADAVRELEEVIDLLSEADESDRRMKIKRVREVYEEMRRLYIDSLMTSLENNEPQESKKGAKRIKDYVMEQEDFLGFFPSNIISGGTVMTLGDAYESMKAIIGKFIDTIRDVVTITKTQSVSKESLALASRDLIGIAEAIEKMFKVPSKIDSDFVKKYKEAAASDPNNQSITNEKPQEGEDNATAPSTDEGDINQEIDQSENIEDAEKEQAKQEAEQTKQWFDGLDDSKKSSIAEFIEQMISRGAQKLEEQDVRPYKNEINPEMRQVINNFSKQTKEFHKGFDKLIPLAIGDMDEEHVENVISIMRDDSENFAKHLKTIFKLKDKLGLDTVMKFVNSMTGKVGELSKELKQKITKKYNEIKPIIQRATSNEMELIKGALKFFATEAADKVAKNKGLTPREKQLIDSFDMQKSLWVQSLKNYLDKSKKGLSDIQKSKYVQMATIYYQTLKSAKREILDQASEKLGIKLNKALISLSSMFSKISSNLRGLAFGFILSLMDPEIKTAEQGSQWADENRVSNTAAASGAKINPDAKVPTKKARRKTVLKNRGDSAPLNVGKPSERTPNMDYYTGNLGRFAEALKPIIEKMLKEHYNH